MNEDYDEYLEEFRRVRENRILIIVGLIISIGLTTYLYFGGLLK